MLSYKTKSILYQLQQKASFYSMHLQQDVLLLTIKHSISQNNIKKSMYVFQKSKVYQKFQAQYIGISSQDPLSTNSKTKSLFTLVKDSSHNIHRMNLSTFELNLLNLIAYNPIIQIEQSKFIGYKNTSSKQVQLIDFHNDQKNNPKVVHLERKKKMNEIDSLMFNNNLLYIHLGEWHDDQDMEHYHSTWQIFDMEYMHNVYEIKSPQISYFSNLQKINAYTFILGEYNFNQNVDSLNLYDLRVKNKRILQLQSSKNSDFVTKCHQAKLYDQNSVLFIKKINNWRSSLYIRDWRMPVQRIQLEKFEFAKISFINICKNKDIYMAECSKNSIKRMIMLVV